MNSARWRAWGGAAGSFSLPAGDDVRIPPMTVLVAGKA
jgi:hypothetical protein